MEPTIITGVLSTVLTAILGLILLIAKKAVTKSGDIHKEQILTQKEQTKAFNKLLTSSEVANANYENFISNCAATTNHVTKRLDSHAGDLKKLNKTQGEQGVRLREHDRRLDNVERKVSDG